MIGADAVTTSLVSFAHEHEADLDCHQHADAIPDSSGRLLRSKNDLRALVRAGMYACPECASPYFGEVHWHADDADGCNWDVCYEYGSAWNACAELIRAVVANLRATYNLDHREPRHARPSLDAPVASPDYF